MKLNLDALEGLHKTNFLIMDEIKKDHPEMFREDGSMRYDLFEKLRAENPIQFRLDVNSASFTLGDNCSIDDAIEILNKIKQNSEQ